MPKWFICKEYLNVVSLKKPFQGTWMLFCKLRCVRHVTVLDFKFDSEPVSMGLVGNSILILSGCLFPHLGWYGGPRGLPGAEHVGRRLCALVHAGQNRHRPALEPIKLLKSRCSVAPIRGGVCRS